MAITSTKVIKYPKGEIGKDASFAVDYKIEMEDGDSVVTALGDPALPAKGDTYNFNGETHPAAHTIKRARIIKASPSKVIAVVTCDYELKQTDPDGPDPNGDPTSDPLEVQVRVTPGYRVVSQAIDKAEFLGYFDKDGNTVNPADPTLTIGTKYPIQNSALVPYIPVPERPISFPTLTIERYYWGWNHNFDGAIGTTNDAAYGINFVDGSGKEIYNRLFQIDELYLHNVTAQQAQFGNRIYYWVTVELWIGDFYLDVPDIGVTQFGSVGVNGKRPLEPIKNKHGENIQEPVALDGNGVALQDPETQGTIYLRWESATSSDFNALGPLVD